jgi:protein TonB
VIFVHGLIWGSLDFSFEAAQKEPEPMTVRFTSLEGLDATPAGNELVPLEGDPVVVPKPQETRIEEPSMPDVAASEIEESPMTEVLETEVKPVESPQRISAKAPETARHVREEASPAEAASVATVSKSEVGASSALGRDGGSAYGESLSLDYRAIILRQLEGRKVYPAAARKRGIIGPVTLCFSVAPDGTVSELSVEVASHRFLRQAALESVRKAAPFSFPERPSGKIDMQVTLEYRLEE